MSAFNAHRNTRIECNRLCAILLGCVASSASAITVTYTDPSTTALIGQPYLEFDNPLQGTETVDNRVVLQWRDAGYPGYEDWVVNDPFGIDGYHNEIWLRGTGDSATTTTTVTSTSIAVHLHGDSNDGPCDIEVDGMLVAQLNMYTGGVADNAIVIVDALPDTVHTIKVTATTAGDVAIMGAAALGGCGASGVVYVDRDAVGLNTGMSWEDAFVDLQLALTQAALVGNVNQIWVAEGSYFPTLPGARLATFQLLNNVAIYGGFEGSECYQAERNPAVHETILTGDLLGDDGVLGNSENCYHVVTASGTDATAILDGFTISAGNADGPLGEDRGGGLYNDGGQATITNCRFTDNMAMDRGGAIYNTNVSGQMLTGCVFLSNSASSGWGGAVFNSASSPTFDGCDFGKALDPSAKNTAAVSGGAMFNATGSTPILNNCDFRDNQADYGGAIFNEDGVATLTDCFFYRNSAQTAAGAVYNDNSDSTIDNCDFHDNSAGTDGGAVLNDESNTTFTDCQFTSNSADWGGAVFNQEAAPMFSNCEFGRPGLGNSADNAGGGVFNWTNADAVIADCRFVENSASSGGAVSNQDGSPILFDNTFDENTAQYYGGALYNLRASPWIVRCRFTNQSASYGGSILSYSDPADATQFSDTLLVNCLFDDNTATGDGGAIDLNGSATVSAMNCRFFNNTAEGDPNTPNGSSPFGGGAISIFSSSASTLTNCTLANNAMNGTDPTDGGGGVFVGDGNDINIVNCILYENTATTAASDEEAQVHLDGSAAAHVDYTCVQGLSGALGGVGNIGGDPQFFNIETGILWLAEGSSCIDVGDNSAIPQDIADLDDDTDTTEPTPHDLAGASRVIDHSGTPTVDMGAYEYVQIGDMNCDGLVDVDDIPAFALALVSSEAYAEAYPFCRVQLADINGDMWRDGHDVIAFTALLTGSN